MERSLLENLLKIKLEALDLVLDSLPEPLGTCAAENGREVVEAVHRVTGEYLARKKPVHVKDTVHRVDIE